MTFNCSSCCHDWTDKVGSSACPLSSFKVTIRRTGTSFTRSKYIGIHSEAHTAARLSPFETSSLKDLIKSQPFSFPLNLLRTRHYHRPNVRRYFSSLCNH